MGDQRSVAAFRGPFEQRQQCLGQHQWSDSVYLEVLDHLLGRSIVEIRWNRYAGIVEQQAQPFIAGNLGKLITKFIVARIVLDVQLQQVQMVIRFGEFVQFVGGLRVSICRNHVCNLAVTQSEKLSHKLKPDSSIRAGNEHGMKDHARKA